jgi:hypothetical protein
MPVSPSSLPETNELELIDEDSLCVPAQAAPVAARSYSSPLEPTATMSVLSSSVLSRFAASSAAPPLYRHASIEKPVVQSTEPVTSARSLVVPRLASIVKPIVLSAEPVASARTAVIPSPPTCRICTRNIVTSLASKRGEDALYARVFALCEHKTYIAIADRLPVPPKPPDIAQKFAPMSRIPPPYWGQ